MKQTTILISAILIATNAISLCNQNNNGNTAASAQNSNDTANNQSRKIIQVKSLDTASIQPGDMLNLSDFTKTPSGVMYKVIKKGSGSKPLQGENVTVNYSGYLLVDGKKVGLKFDSSFDRNQPFVFKLGAGSVIPGWEISLADMKVGETRIVILPSKLAYGSRAIASIPADSTLIFEITLIKAS